MAEETIAKIVAFANSEDRMRDPGDFIRSITAPNLPKSAQHAMTTPTLPVPGRSRTLPNFSESYESLAAGFEVGEQEIKDWLKSKYFEPFWNTYLEEFLKPTLEQAKKASKSHVMGGGLPVAISRLEDGERLGVAKYSTTRPNKQDWDCSDHLAYLLYWWQRENVINQDGLFFSKKWQLVQQYHAIFQAKIFDTQAPGKARLARATAGEKRKRGEEE